MKLQTPTIEEEKIVSVEDVDVVVVVPQLKTTLGILPQGSHEKTIDSQAEEQLDHANMEQAPNKFMIGLSDHKEDG